MVTDKDVVFLSKRIKELADRAFKSNIVTNTFFLNLNEQTVFFSIKNLPDINYKLIGGYEAAERKVVCFFPVDFNEGEESDIFDYLYVSPANEKFSDRLTHRDYLGAAMNLGIERNMIGDIIMSGNSAYIIVLKKISWVVADNLTNVKKTKVTIRIDKKLAVEAAAVNQIKRINTASLRIDALIAAVFNLSRGSASKYLDSERVFVNSKCILSHSLQVQPGNIISVRGIGRFKYLGEESTTKKGRLMASVECY